MAGTDRLNTEAQSRMEERRGERRNSLIPSRNKSNFSGAGLHPPRSHPSSNVGPPCSPAVLCASVFVRARILGPSYRDCAQQREPGPLPETSPPSVLSTEVTLQKPNHDQPDYQFCILGISRTPMSVRFRLFARDVEPPKRINPRRRETAGSHF